MKKLFLFIFFSPCLYSQTITVREINLAYDEEKHIMPLTIPKEITRMKNRKEEIEVVICKSFCLSINDKISKPFFSYMGATLDSSNSFFTLRPSNCIEVIENSVFEFYDIEPEEYILQVCNVFEEKKRSNVQSGTLVIQ